MNHSEITFWYGKKASIIVSVELLASIRIFRYVEIDLFFIYL